MGREGGALEGEEKRVRGSGEGVGNQQIRAPCGRKRKPDLESMHEELSDLGTKFDPQMINSVTRSF
jgi:hypothetical protein